MAGIPVLVKQGDFLCYRSQSPGRGDDVVAHFLGAVGPAPQPLGAPHRRLGLYPFWRHPRRGVLERGREATGLVLAGGQQVG